MEVKKSEKADLRKRVMLFLQLGLVITLAVAYFGLNHKTYDKVEIDAGQVSMDDLDEEEIPITELLNTPPPPPPPPPPPEEIEVVEDEEEIEDEVIANTESDQEQEVIEVDDIEEEEVEEEIADVPFTVLEDAPVFPGCEGAGSKREKKACTEEKIRNFVFKKFDTDLAGDLGLEGQMRISVVFKIDTNGNVVDVRARAPHPDLQAEAIKVVKRIPKMTPGKQRGNAVNVPYSLPILFKVEN